MKKSFTWDDYIKIGYNKEWFTTRASTQDEFSFYFHPVVRKNYGLNEESIITASILDETIGYKNIAILYSGGIDSEFIVNSFIQYGKIPELIFLKFGENNLYDFSFAKKLAHENNLSLTIIEMDVMELHQSGEALELCNKYQSSQSGYVPYLKAIELLSRDKYLILGDDPVFEYHNKEWCYCLREHTFSWWKAFFINKTIGCPNYILYSPDLFYSFINTRRMSWLFSQHEIQNSTLIKSDIYRESMFVNRRLKMTGTEKIIGPLLHTNKLIYEKYDLSIPDTKYISYKKIIKSYENKTAYIE